MSLTNHLLAGATIAKFVPLPLAIPLAFLSHFVLDALPHFGFSDYKKRRDNMWWAAVLLIIDLSLAILLATWLLSHHHSWWLIAGLVAYSPDTLWLYRFTVEEKWGKREPTEGNWFIRLHNNIQHFEKPSGLIVEIIVGTVLFLTVR